MTQQQPGGVWVYTASWEESCCLDATAAAEAERQPGEPGKRGTRPQRRDGQNVNDSAAPLGGCVSVLVPLWRKASRRRGGDTLLNDYDSECCPV